jgi:predicted transcriptional regulator
MENAVHLGIALKEADFQVSQICCSRNSCFDLAARKNNTTLLVKVNSDVDTFSPNSARELKVIADRVSAASLVISQQAHGKPLEDDTVYSRNGIFVVTEKTICNIARHHDRRFPQNPLRLRKRHGKSIREISL